MQKTLQVAVTQEHIDKGLRGKRQQCPIGRAVKALPGVIYGEIGTAGYSRVHFFSRDGVHAECHLYEMSKAATRFAQTFDRKGADGVTPSTFRLRRVSDL